MCLHRSLKAGTVTVRALLVLGIQGIKEVSWRSGVVLLATYFYARSVLVSDATLCFSLYYLFSAVSLLKRFGAVFKSSPRFINAQNCDEVTNVTLA